MRRQYAQNFLPQCFLLAGDEVAHSRSSLGELDFKAQHRNKQTLAHERIKPVPNAPIATWRRKIVAAACPALGGARCPYETRSYISENEGNE
jgi:hypothetical protein